jgi:hypothetical protein
MFFTIHKEDIPKGLSMAGLEDVDYSYMDDVRRGRMPRTLS